MSTFKEEEWRDRCPPYTWSYFVAKYGDVPYDALFEDKMTEEEKRDFSSLCQPGALALMWTTWREGKWAKEWEELADKIADRVAERLTKPVISGDG